MKVKGIDHICIAVKDMAAAEDHFIRLFGAEKILNIVRDDTHYTGTYLKFGDSILTLACPTSPESHVARFIERRGEGLNHMGIEVTDREAAKAEFLAHGGVLGPEETVPNVRSEFAPSVKSNYGLVLQVIEYEAPYRDMAPVERYEQLKKDDLLYS